MSLRPPSSLFLASLLIFFLSFVPAPSSAGVERILVYHFTVGGCPECLRVSLFLVSLEASYPGLEVKEFNISHREVQEKRGVLDDLYQVELSKRGVVPAIFIGRRYLIEEGEITENLKRLIEEFKPEDEGYLIQKGREEGKENIKKIFLSFSPLVISGAGLVDGVNPCAFAVILFFISYLSLKKNPGIILLTGLSFSLGIFLSYFILGLGLFRTLLSFSQVSLLTKIFFLLVGAFALVLSLLSFIDYLRIRRGREKQMILQLPSYLKKKSHEMVKKEFKVLPFYISSFLIAFPVSLTEFLCTGQVYLPTIVYITGIPELRVKAVYYLLLYNLFFILPLIALFLLAYLGASSERLLAFFKKRLATSKLLLALVFLLLSLFIFSLGFRSG